MRQPQDNGNSRKECSYRQHCGPDKIHIGESETEEKKVEENRRCGEDITEEESASVISLFAIELQTAYRAEIVHGITISIDKASSASWTSLADHRTE
jgi:hypothetical protein